MIIDDTVKILLPTTLSFLFGVLLTFVLSHYLYKYRMWKKKGGKIDLAGNTATVFNELHATRETGTPRLGGVVVWGSACLTLAAIYALTYIAPGTATEKLQFFSRNQTWIPFFLLLLGGLVGAIDDILEVQGSVPGKNGGLTLWKRLGIVTLASAATGFWFYEKLGVHAVGIPFVGNFELGALFVPFFILVTLAIYAGGVIDGIDGLAGGIFGAIFASYAGIALYQQQIDLAAFCAMIVGGILAFLWFNIPPARFYLSETGTMALTLSLSSIAFLTDSGAGGHGVISLLIIALPLFVTVASNIIQVLSKRLRGKKIFRVAPLHHHFEAIGWPPYKVTMRYWIIGIICSILGFLFAVVGYV